MPTPVCPRIFSKIEDLNPEISINVWEWALVRIVHFGKILNCRMLDEIWSDLSRSVPKKSATNFIGDLHRNACHSQLEIGKVSELVKKIGCTYQ
jgi:hypothetical protein